MKMFQSFNQSSSSCSSSSALDGDKKRPDDGAVVDKFTDPDDDILSTVRNEDWYNVRNTVSSVSQHFSQVDGCGDRSLDDVCFIKATTVECTMVMLLLEESSPHTIRRLVFAPDRLTIVAVAASNGRRDG